MSTETLTSGEICRRYNIGRAALIKWRADPTFPEPLTWSRYGGGTWDAGQIAEWRRRQLNRRHERRRHALAAYKRHAGEHGHLTAVADAYEVDVGTLRGWVKAAGLPLPRDVAA